MSRTEARKLRKQEDMYRIFRQAGFIGSIIIVAAIIGGAIWYFTGNTGRITGIEKHAPTEVEALFVSDNNQSSWEYITTMANAPSEKPVSHADKVGVGFLEGKSYLYVEGKGQEFDDEMKNLGYSEKPHIDNVWLLAGEAKGLVEDGLGKADHYDGAKIKNATSSFGYITNKNFNSSLKGDNGLPTDKWTWFGTFANGAWVGHNGTITSENFDLKKFKTWSSFNKKTAITDNVFTEEAGTIGIHLPKSKLKDFTGFEFNTGIDDIKVTLNKEGIMELSFERNK